MGLCTAVALSGISVELNETLRLLIFPLVIGICLAVIPRFVKTPGERRKDVREELKEVWARLDTRDDEVEELREKLRKRDEESAIRDTQIQDLQKHVKELEEYKVKYANAMLENEVLKKELRDYDALKRKVARLEQELHDLKAGQG